MRSFLTAMAVAISMASPAAAAGLCDFVGDWEKQSGNSIARLSIVDAGSGRLQIEGWGVCSPNPCEWGTANGAAFSSGAGTVVYSNTQAVMASWDSGFARSTVVLTALPGDKLEAKLYTEFTDGSGRSNYVSTQRLRRTAVVGIPGIPGLPPIPGIPPILIPGGGSPGGGGVGGLAEDCVSFNPATTTYDRIGGSYKVVDGDHWIIDFGGNKPEAVQTAELIQHYGLTQLCYVGRPNPSFTYFLRDGNAPSGAFPGEDCLSFNTANARATFSGGQWKIMNGSQAMFAFGSNEDEARQAEAIIQAYGFRRSCFIGRPDPSVQYLRR